MATSEQYGQLCDVVERAWKHWPANEGGGLLHTSARAREGANRILEILGLEVDDSNELSPPTRDEIEAAEREAFDRLWYHRAISSPPADVEQLRAIESEYGDLKIETDHDFGLLEGRLAALRWVLTGFDHADTIHFVPRTSVSRS